MRTKSGATTYMTMFVNEATIERELPPVHPGEVVKEEFLDPCGLSQYELAKRTGMPAQRVGQIVLGKRGVLRER